MKNTTRPVAAGLFLLGLANLHIRARDGRSAGGRVGERKTGHRAEDRKGKKPRGLTLVGRLSLKALWGDARERLSGERRSGRPRRWWVEVALWRNSRGETQESLGETPKSRDHG